MNANRREYASSGDGGWKRGRGNGSMGDHVLEFLAAAAEMSVEFGRGCRDIVKQTLMREDSFIVKNFGTGSYFGRKVSGAFGKLKVVNDYLPEDKDPMHAWSVIVSVLLLAFLGNALEVFGKLAKYSAYFLKK